MINKEGAGELVLLLLFLVAKSSGINDFILIFCRGSVVVSYFCC